MLLYVSIPIVHVKNILLLYVSTHIVHVKNINYNLLQDVIPRGKQISNRKKISQTL